MNERSSEHGSQSQSAADTLSRFFIDNFAKLDADRDDYVSESELNTARSFGNFHGNDLNLLDILIDNRETLQAMNPHETPSWRADENGITVGDMSVFAASHNEISARLSKGKAMIDFLSNNYSRIDRDNNGFINQKELFRAATNQTFSDAERKLATEISTSQAFDRLEEASNDEWFFDDDGITRNDLQKARPIDTVGSVRSWHPHVLGGDVNCRDRIPEAYKVLSVLYPKR